MSKTKPTQTRIVFIIYGENVPLMVDPNASWEVARAEALEKSYNTGRPPAEWGIRDECGERIDPISKVGELRGIVPSIRIFLSREVAGGGTTP